jgi:ABC-type transport system involved in cytochrome c biogenesis permease subunit
MTATLTANTCSTRRFGGRLLLFLRLSVIGLALPLLVLTWQLILSVPSVPPASSQRPPLGQFDFAAWAAIPVQDARIKPLEVACQELLREISGGSRFAGGEPLAVVMTWRASRANRWETIPFILCDHHRVREEIAKGRPDLPEGWTTGKFVSPSDLRQSAAFAEVVKRASQLRGEFREKAHQRMSVVELKSEEVARRLQRYDAVRGARSTTLGDLAILADRVVSLAEFSESSGLDRAEAVAQLERTVARAEDPLRLVNLDSVPDAGWFSFAELQLMSERPELWTSWTQQRILERPLAYLSPELQKLLDPLRTRSAEQIQAAIDQLADRLGERRRTRIDAFDEAFQSQDRQRTNRLLAELLPDESRMQRFMAQREQVASEISDLDALHQACLPLLEKELAEDDRKQLERLRLSLRQIPQAEQGPDTPEFRAAALDYLELLLPDFYARLLDAHPFPAEAVEAILGLWERTCLAFDAGDDAAFQAASTVLLAAIGERNRGGWSPTRIGWERWLNSFHPFRWGWIAMLVAAVGFGLASGLDSSIWYRLAFGVYLASLALQILGFTVRTYIAERAPVANMYETVVFVAGMTGLFALVLECVYRSRVIGIAGSLVAALGLILADQLPLALDPKISPMVPVLRTNFWLTVHVLTIVAGYAGAALAWGLGNISLGLLAFGKGSRESLKRLAEFTNRAMQIAVLLLATGTLLGALWAAESWGRFWGWDPKEVGALVALVCYVIPLHARYVGWVREFGLAVSAVLCFASIIVSWYVINFLLAAGLHSYGFSAGGGVGVLWATVLNLEWLAVATLIYGRHVAVAGEPAQHDDTMPS